MGTESWCKEPSQMVNLAFLKLIVMNAPATNKIHEKCQWSLMEMKLDWNPVGFDECADADKNSNCMCCSKRSAAHKQGSSDGCARKFEFEFEFDFPEQGAVEFATVPTAFDM